MSKTVAEVLVETLAQIGVKQVFGIVGDALGVAHISVPPDIFGAKVSGEVPSLTTLRPRPEVAPAQADIDEAIRLIGEAKTVLCSAASAASAPPKS
ncbi:MAG TPA: hypothetical protein VFW13_09410 [Phenylobacterium sp.]|nr:hypothetical protein [Phenylobacterium sp.]